MPIECIDLSLPIDSSQSEPEPVRIERIDHRVGAEILTRDSEVTPDDFPEGLGINFERIKITSHSGTHIDSPLHYGPNCKGMKARSIDEMPLDWFYGTSLVLDCSEGGSSSENVTLEEAKRALDVQAVEISKGDIVLIYTGADSLWGTPEYFTDFRGISPQLCQWILDFGVRVIGVDTFGFDPPFRQMLKSYEESKNRELLWPCHMLGRSIEYCQIERLANLGSLPKGRKFMISCFPIRLKGCGAAPARVVALLEG